VIVEHLEYTTFFGSRSNFEWVACQYVTMTLKVLVEVGTNKNWPLLGSIGVIRGQDDKVIHTPKILIRPMAFGQFWVTISTTMLLDPSNLTCITRNRIARVCREV